MVESLTAPAESRAKQTDELRLALAIRGGVSLAVWMGGACTEVARLRSDAGKPTSEQPPTTYQRLLALAGYKSVVVDVIAGTSAGGLNGILLSQHIATGAGFGRGLRDVWLEVGDLDALTRRPSFTPPPSLLRGDDGFYRSLLAAMQRLAGTPSPGTHPLRLLITATRLSARPDALFPAVGSPVPAGRSRAFFRFRYQPNGGPAFSDFSGGATQKALAYAARTTSSFPAAFEPARPLVARPASPPDPARVDVRGVCSETGVPDLDLDGAVELMDGGVLNNIPLGWAVSSIAGMPADNPVDRWLLFLQPVSPGPPKPAVVGSATSPKKARSASRVVRLLREMLSVKMGSESVLDSMEDLRALVDRSAQLDAILDASAASLGPQSSSQAAFSVYQKALVTAEMNRLRNLLTDPLTTMAADPLLIPETTFPLRAAVSAAGSDEPLPLRMPDLSSPQAVARAAELVLQPGTTQDQVGCNARTPIIAARAVTLLLHVVRKIERESGGDFAQERKQLYGLRLTVETIIAVRDRLILSLATDQPLQPPDSLLRQATVALQGLMGAMPAPTAASTTWLTWSQQLAAGMTSASPTDDEWPSQIYQPLWDAVAEVAAKIQKGIELTQLEVLTGAMRPDPLAAATSIAIAVCSASNESPLEGAIFPDVLTAQTRTERKLSGNQVANFAAFLSARWRLNDWIWGRMDGAQTLVDIVAGRGRLDLTMDQTRDFFVGALEVKPAWTAELEKRWESTYQNRPAAEVTRAAIVERLQWEILAEELPDLELLSDRGDGRDRPPSSGDIPAAAPDPVPPTKLQLEMLAAVGDESVVELLPRPDLRRTLLRLGLVAWRAILPAGGVGGALQGALFLTVAPTLFLPILLAVVAPVASILAAAGVWITVAATTHRWGSWAQIPTALGFTLACFVFAWQRWSPWASRKRRTNTNWYYGGWWVPVAVGVSAAAASALTLACTWGSHVNAHGQGTWVVAVFAGISVLLPLMYVAKGTGVKGSLLVALLAVGVAVVSALTSWGVDRDLWWAGVLVLYATLLSTLLGLQFLLSDEPTTAGL